MKKNDDRSSYTINVTKDRSNHESVLSVTVKGFLTRVTLITCLPIDWFYTYRDINDGSALLGNNMACVTIETQNQKQNA